MESTTKSRPVRLRKVGSSYTITIPQDIIEESRFPLGSWLTIAYDRENNTLVASLAVQGGYITATESKSRQKYKYQSELDDFNAWIREHPEQSIDDYLKVRKSKFKDKLVAKGVVKKEDAN